MTPITCCAAVRIGVGVAPVGSTRRSSGFGGKSLSSALSFRERYDWASSGGQRESGWVSKERPGWKSGFESSKHR